jgi:hypothetical protein
MLIFVPNQGAAAQLRVRFDRGIRTKELQVYPGIVPLLRRLTEIRTGLHEFSTAFPKNLLTEGKIKVSFIPL